MAALVTLEQAKQHLRITSVDQDADLNLKCEQASAIILKYLKRRAHEGLSTAAIVTSSVASPTVITTQSPHTIVAAATVFISGHSASVPDINGTRVISTPTADTFTIPVAVTTAGTGGKVSVLWTDETVPWDVQASVLVMLTHLMEHRGDDMEGDAAVWEAIGRVLVGSRDPALA